MPKPLASGQLAHYRCWLEVRERLRELTRQLKEFSIAVVDEDPHTPEEADRPGAERSERPALNV